jgi:hypothetical protein
MAGFGFAGKPGRPTAGSLTTKKADDIFAALYRKTGQS